MFLDLLPEDGIQKIVAYEVTQGDDNEDHFIWDATSHGGFSINSMVIIIRKNIQEEMDPIWKLTWHAPLPQRVRLFL